MRLNKRLRVNNTPLSSFRIRSSTENGSPSLDWYRKRTRKSTQLPHFEVYENKISKVNSPNLGAQNEFTPVLIKPQTGKI
jgi:hypothetical protein